MSKTSLTPVIVWADLTKCGRVTAKDLNFVTAVVKKGLEKLPSKSIGLLIAPVLVSERSQGERGEWRCLGKFKSKTYDNLKLHAAF